MKLHRITICNFGSFRGEQTFHFPKEPGLFFMQGINAAEPRLEANGSGKTTIWRALTWLLYGKDPKGMKAGDVANWDAGKNAWVELAYETDSKLSLCVMKRTWSPNSWTLVDLFGNKTDLAKDPSNPVLAAIGLEFEPFLNTILMAQGQPMFLDLDHNAKATLFSKVLGLDRWLRYSSEASEFAKGQDVITRRHERELAAMQGEVANNDNINIGQHADDWKADWKKRSTELEKRYNAKLILRPKLKQASTEASELAEFRRHNVESQHVITKKCVDELLDFDDDLNILEQAFTVAKTRYTVVIESREALKAGVCPTCRQPIHLAKDNSAEEAREALKRRDEAQRKLKGVLDDYEVCKKAEANARDDLRELERRHEDSVDASKNCVRDLAMLDRELDVMEDQAEALAAEKNPYAELHDLMLRDRDALLAKIDAKQRLLDDSQSRYSLYSFWVRGFKDLRLQLIAEALNELEIEVNNCVMSLGLVDWELNFQVDRETKGGNIQRGFNVVVRSPHNMNPVPWEAWSGGEAQRLRNAGNMGLANLIRSRTGTALNLEVWDEPTQGLSPQGVQDLLEALAGRAQQENRQIWLVDHRAHNFGGFAGGAVITKTAKGSSLTQY